MHGQDGDMAYAAVGVDGCPAGWIAVFRESDGAAGAPKVAVFARFSDILSEAGPAIVAVDMPIGLPDRVTGGGRGPEQALRPHLGARQSSVFAIPARAAIYATDYAAACASALAGSDPPRKVSRQAFNLFPKIREIDEILRALGPEGASRVHESHPEGAFMVMNGGRPLTHPKKVKSRPFEPGLEERRALLARHGLAGSCLAGPGPRGAGIDDLLDACACSVTALRILRGEARRFPATEPGRDAFGLPMAIWA
jgi:predicted RNase H-like nuclease